MNGARTTACIFTLTGLLVGSCGSDSTDSPVNVTRTATPEPTATPTFVALTRPPTASPSPTPNFKYPIPQNLALPMSLLTMKQRVAGAYRESFRMAADVGPPQLKNWHVSYFAEWPSEMGGPFALATWTFEVLGGSQEFEFKAQGSTVTGPVRRDPFAPGFLTPTNVVDGAWTAPGIYQLIALILVEQPRTNAVSAGPALWLDADYQVQPNSIDSDWLIARGDSFARFDARGSYFK